MIEHSYNFPLASRENLSLEIDVWEDEYDGLQYDLNFRIDFQDQKHAAVCVDFNGLSPNELWLLANRLIDIARLDSMKEVAHYHAKQELEDDC